MNDTDRELESIAVAKEAQKIADEAESGAKTVTGPTRFIIPIIAVAWSLFQLSLASVLLLEAIYIRAIHLAFALTLVFLSYPMFKKSKKSKLFSYFSVKNRFTISDYTIAIFAGYYRLIYCPGLFGSQRAAGRSNYQGRSLWFYSGCPAAGSLSQGSGSSPSYCGHCVYSIQFFRTPYAICALL